MLANFPHNTCKTDGNALERHKLGSQPGPVTITVTITVTATVTISVTISVPVKIPVTLSVTVPTVRKGMKQVFHSKYCPMLINIV